MPVNVVHRWWCHGKLAGLPSRIRARMKARDITRNNLCNACEIHYSMFEDWLHGNVGLVDPVFDRIMLYLVLAE